MDQAESRHSPGSALRYLMAGESKGFRVSAPDVTCSLAFTANVKSLLSNQYAQMELPPGELAKLDGPATIEGDALIVAVYNRTDWHVSEVAVALTIIKKSVVLGGMSIGDAETEVRPEKKPDLTTIYRIRAAAPPWETTVFSTSLKTQLAADEEWHWAIVQARGYPPQTYSRNVPRTAAESTGPAAVQVDISSADLDQADVVAGCGRAAEHARGFTRRQSAIGFNPTQIEASHFTNCPFCTSYSTRKGLCVLRSCQPSCAIRVLACARRSEGRGWERKYPCKL